MTCRRGPCCSTRRTGSRRTARRSRRRRSSTSPSACSSRSTPPAIRARSPLIPPSAARAPRRRALSRLRTANFIFAGPGSPSYALSVWRGSPIPEALATRLTDGAALVFASAAALTLGRFTIPVYEIYKAGQPAQWLDGLDLMRAAGFEGSCVVIPHYDNAEGGTHDTRFCYHRRAAAGGDGSDAARRRVGAGRRRAHRGHHGSRRRHGLRSPAAARSPCGAGEPRAASPPASSSVSTR